MKTRSIILLSGLIIGLAFSVLLVRVASLERENARQCEQIAVMREQHQWFADGVTSREITRQQEQAKEAFDRREQPQTEFGSRFHSVHIVRPKSEVSGWHFPRHSDIVPGKLTHE